MIYLQEKVKIIPTLKYILEAELLKMKLSEIEFEVNEGDVIHTINYTFMYDKELIEYFLRKFLK